MVNQFLDNLYKLYEVGDIVEAEIYLKDTLEFYLKEYNYNGCISVLNEMMGYYRTISRYEESILCIEKIMEIIDVIGDIEPLSYATILLNSATSYRASKQYEKADYFYKKTYEIIKENSKSDDYLLASFYNNRSLFFIETEKLIEAKNDLEKAINIINSKSEYDLELAISYTNLGTVYFRINDILSGMESMKKAISIFEQSEVKDSHYSAALSGLAEAYYHKNELEKSLLYYNKSLEQINIFYGENEDYTKIKNNINIIEELIKRKKKFLDSGKKGLEISREYYNEVVKPMLVKDYPEYIDRIAVGLIGEGSECFGYDDEYSTDHDYGAGVCLWLTKDDYNEIGLKLQESYIKLSKMDTRFLPRNISMYGENRVGVFSIDSFLKMITGYDKAPINSGDWHKIPEEMLYVLCNGQIFEDKLGEFTDRISEFYSYPEEVRIENIANLIGEVSQAGQYNYKRMKLRGDIGGLYLTISKFIESVIKLSYLLENRFRPYYKWQMKDMDKFKYLTDIKEKLKKLMVTNIEDDSIESQIESICDDIRIELKRQSLTSETDKFLELHKQEIISNIKQLNNNKKIETLIKDIVELEWKQFQLVKNEGGRADCQNDKNTFEIMRRSQFLSWDLEVLKSYYNDIVYAQKTGRNLLEEKYARMMVYKEPEKYTDIERELPLINENRLIIQEEIIAQEIIWAKELSQLYPNLRGNARILYSKYDTEYDTSIETYIRGEISTYSDKTLDLYRDMIKARVKENRNLEKENLLNMVREYGYSSIEEAENLLN